MQMDCQTDYQNDQRVDSEIPSKEREKLLVDLQFSPDLHCMALRAISCSNTWKEYFS